MSYFKKSFGFLNDKREVFLHTLKGENFSFSVMDYGACITNIVLDNSLDVVSGFDNVTPYEGNCGSMGFTIGRHANRIANAEFLLNGKKYVLEKNNGQNHLHGGIKNLSTKLFHCEYSCMENESLTFSTQSSDGECGYPGNLDFEVQFSLIKPRTLRIEYKAKTDITTIVNFTNHSYFNLNGHNYGSILDHNLKINADYVLDIREGLIPTGKLNHVENTLFDFRNKKSIKEVIYHKDEDYQIAMAGGLDHNYCVNNSGKKQYIGSLYADQTDWQMNVYTSEPGVQVYSACTTYVNDGKDNAHYGNYSLVCLETQHYPDSIHHNNFPSIILNPSDEFYSITEYEFINQQH